MTGSEQRPAVGGAHPQTPDQVHARHERQNPRAVSGSQPASPSTEGEPGPTKSQPVQDVLAAEEHAESLVLGSSVELGGVSAPAGGDRPHQADNRARHRSQQPGQDPTQDSGQVREEGRTQESPPSDVQRSSAGGLQYPFPGGVPDQDPLIDIAPMPDNIWGEADFPAVAVPEPHATVAEGERQPDWHRHTDGRWIVGNAGSQHRTVAKPTRRPSGAPADTELDAAQVGAISYRAASMRGFSHQETGKPRQDAFTVRVTRSDGWLVACVADGVSDAPRSEVAAKVAAEVVARKLVTALDTQPVPAEALQWEQVVTGLPWLDALQETNGALTARARQDLETIYRGKGDRDALQSLPHPLPSSHARKLMATTAVALAVGARPDPQDRYPFAVGVLAGDSAGYLIREGRWRPVLAPKDAAAAMTCNDVRALPGRTTPVVRFGWLVPGDAAALFSDGVSDPLGRGEGVVGRFLLSHWQSPPDLLQFAGHVGFYRKSFFDDRTAVVVWTHTPRGAL